MKGSRFATGVCLGALGASFPGSGLAFAQQEAEYGPPRPALAVMTIEGEQGRALPVEIYGPSANVSQDRPIARCTTPCFARLPTGRYKLHVAKTEDTLAGSRVFDLDGTSRVEVSPDEPWQRTTGLVLGIGGPVAIVTGIVLLVTEATSRSVHSCADDTCSWHEEAPSDSVVAAGALLIVGGLAATPIGWVMFGKSFKPEVRVTPAGGYGYGARPGGSAFALPAGGTLGIRTEF
ncbi:MAG TPA: hypothetical protein VHE30_20790 [Polyangiaceae bacterium]|nr:hypothetical protein [Polyangiaceae bacterium]